jgi:pyruvate/2-oxoacid:ferredoxin oxidoreductase beta subunit
MHYQLNPMPEKIPVKEYVRLQGRFSHLSEKQMEAIQKETDTKWEELLDRAHG